MAKIDSAEAFIEVLNARGVEHIFFNPGGEQGALLATIAKYRLLGKPCPQLILCLDESVALTAAHCHYMVSGRPQFVLVHSELGTLQLGGALHNAQWGRIPVIIFAGTSPAGQRTNWKGETYEQGMSVRNCAKWDYTIQPGENIYEVLDKAFSTAFTEPCGPVYLGYPRDLVSEKIERIDIPASPIVAPFIFPPVGAATIDKVAETLLAAENPLIVAGYTGRHPETVAALVELAETLCSPVMPGPVYMNFPTDHPLCAGVEQIMGSKTRNPDILSEADTILVLDYDVPYVAAPGVPKQDANIIQFDIDPLTAGRPLWGRGANTYIEADSRQVIPALTAAVQARLTPEKTAILKERYTHLADTHKKQREEWRQDALNVAGQRPISPDWVCYCVDQVIDEDTILLHHTISHFASATQQIPRTKPGTMLSCPAGSIQWALGGALGVKVAAPDKLVVSIMSDGGYVWGSPVAALWPAVTYKKPFLGIIMNNQSYGFIKLLVERSYGEGSIPDRMAFEAGVDIAPPPDYAAVAQACGAYGRTVTDPDDVLPALKEALEHVEKGRPAILDMVLEKDVRSVTQ